MINQSIKNLIGLFLSLALLETSLGCQSPTATEIPQTPAENTAPSAETPLDLTGVWSGTHVKSGPDWASNYKATLNLTQQKGDTVSGTLVLTFINQENSVSPDQNTGFVGHLSGNTLQGPMPGMTYQISGNSMTGQGMDTDGVGPMAVTWEWSWNLTRVR